MTNNTLFAALLIATPLLVLPCPVTSFAESSTEIVSSRSEQSYDENGKAVGETSESEIAESALEQAANGIEFTGGMTAIIQGTSGAESTDTNDQTDASISVDLVMVYNHEDQYYFIVALESGWGAGINDNFPSDMAPDYDSYNTLSHTRQENITMSQAYLESIFFDKAFVVNVGKMDTHSLYDTNQLASDETTNFIAGALVRAAGVVSHELDQYYSPTLRLYFAPASWLEMDAIYAHSEMDDLSRNPFLVFQLNIKPGFGGLEGNYRFFVVHDGRNYEDTGGDKARHDLVLGVSFDQYITDNVGLFFRYSSHDKNLLANNVVSLISGGITFSGGIWARPDDLIGVGYAQLELNKDLNPPYENGQSVLELYYNIRLNSMISLTPDVQMHQNLPREKDRNVTVYGLRAQVDF